MDMSFVLNNFFRLRILDASGTRINQLSSAVGNLKHLRQLNLSGTQIRTLPYSICSLWNLQVLNLDDCEKLEALPKKTRYLVNLRHLFLEDCESLTEMPSKIGELTSLRTLSQFIVGRNRGNRLEELQCLKLGGKLTIRHLERVENLMDAKKANLAEKENLLHLNLQWESDNDAPTLEEKESEEKVFEALEPHRNLEILWVWGFNGRHFPDWMSNSTLEKLVDVHISSCKNFLHLPQLGELPHLKYLWVTTAEEVEYIIEDPLISVRQFPSLKTLYLWSLPNLKGFLKQHVTTKSVEAFSNLEELRIEDCSSLKIKNLNNCLKTVILSNLPNMVCVPKALQHVSDSLQYLYLFGLTQLSSLPGWLGILRCLEDLSIRDCLKIASIPDSIRGMTKLRYLSVQECPELERRCEREKGEDWHKIAHIPHLQIGEWIP
ncbi:hypothetical protein MIMGU_mgv1a020013mg [Erythranthe guttata]|uniref:R13L1/DRL21-like LRR repeat region domain-containing protein n=1 Tax=Erythranthe guttata TaxID=4155 RepID=A0A022Q8H9_ERYGU|nr:hypothetical protein MIMGU_mgv1a020013mg [Erythranthe guttata]